MRGAVTYQKRSSGEESAPTKCLKLVTALPLGRGARRGKQYMLLYKPLNPNLTERVVEYVSD